MNFTAAARGPSNRQLKLSKAKQSTSDKQDEHVPEAITV